MTLNLQEDGLILCQHGVGLSDGGLGACHSLTWAATKDADVAEKVWTASIMERKS